MASRLIDCGKRASFGCHCCDAGKHAVSKKLQLLLLLFASVLKAGRPQRRPKCGGQAFGQIVLLAGTSKTEEPLGLSREKDREKGSGSARQWIQCEF